MNPPDVHITLLKDSFDIDYQATVNCVEAGMAKGSPGFQYLSYGASMFAIAFYLSICLSVYLSIYLSICLSVYLSIYVVILVWFIGLQEELTNNRM